MTEESLDEFKKWTTEKIITEEKIRFIKFVLMASLTVILISYLIYNIHRDIKVTVEQSFFVLFCIGITLFLWLRYLFFLSKHHRVIDKHEREKEESRRLQKSGSEADSKED